MYVFICVVYMRKHWTLHTGKIRACVCLCAMCIEWKVLFVFHSSFVFFIFAFWQKQSESLRHHFVNWMMTLLQPTQFTQQSNEASEKGKKMNSLNLTTFDDMGLHTHSQQKRYRKYERMHHHAQNVHSILYVDSFNQQFSDRWLGALLCASARW